ncbi:MAG: YfcE family phosphodiesterase [Dehalococcoidia bacterium]|nr:YfcE family phosphodiesterase [Dehalococcoidia bacterium]
MSVAKNQGTNPSDFPTTHVLVLADTHVATIQQLPAKLSELVGAADYVVHCGDYTSIKVVEELGRLAKRFIGVYGNSDQPEVKEQLPREATFEVGNKKVVVTHPYFGGPPWGLEDELVERYPEADVILFGHTHDRHCVTKNGKLLLNPGQGYPTFIHPMNVGILKVMPGGVEGRACSLDEATLDK